MSMRRFYIVGFGALMLFDTTTQVSIKLATLRSGEFTFALDYVLALLGNPWLYTAIGGYLGAFVTWMTLLKRAPVGPAFAASHLELIPVMLISLYLFNEKLSLTQIAGCVCIVAGIVFLSLSEARQPQEKDAAAQD